MQRQKNDVYVKQRLQPKKGSSALSEEEYDEVGGGGYVARSAFKLLQLDDQYKFLRAGRVIVDLGAAPGGWSQAIVERTSKTRSKKDEEKKMSGRATKVFALDLLPVVGIEGVQSIQGDFLDPAMQDKLRKMVQGAATGSISDETMEDGGFVDVVVSDMMGESATEASGT
ncbi:hypothetical protein NDA16_000658 [Ustilago loliicola]|nr:hypothetical protein NDA16_000658 [Ustilago loliicola]